jgi:chaperonin GroEL
MRGILRVAAVKAHGWGDHKRGTLDDIAIITGATVVSKNRGMRWDRFDKNWFGECRTATLTSNKTTIIDGKGEKEALEKQVEVIKKLIEKDEKNKNKIYVVQNLQERLSRFIGGVSIIHVGGSTESEMLEKKDRFDDSLHATKAAIQEGILPGGGSALVHARKAIDTSTIGGTIVYDAISKPFTQILINAGLSKTDAEIICNHQLTNIEKDWWQGYNLKKSSVVNMKEDGIIDPFKVTRLALENAASAAGQFLLTEAVMVQIDNMSDEDKVKEVLRNFQASNSGKPAIED